MNRTPHDLQAQASMVDMVDCVVERHGRVRSQKSNEERRKVDDRKSQLVSQSVSESVSQ